MLDHPLAGVVAGALLAFALQAARSWWHARRTGDVAAALDKRRLLGIERELRAIRRHIERLDQRLADVDRGTLASIRERLAGVEATVALLLSYADPANPRRPPPKG